MSNRSFASIYNGSSSHSGGGGGGSDIFGDKARRQKDVMALQQAQDLEKMKAAADIDSKQTAQEGDIASKAHIQQVGLDAAKAAQLVPPGVTADVLSPEQMKLINTLGETHLALQQKTQDSPNYQDAYMKGAAALQAKPDVENAEGRARAQALSTTTLPPNNIARVGMPGGDVSAKPQDFRGMTQQTQMVGGYKMPDGTMFGQKPVDTYSGGSFPPVGKISLGDSQNLTNNIQSKPSDQFSNPALDKVLSTPVNAGQPPVGANPIMTKPPTGMVNDMNARNVNAGPGELNPWVKWLMQRTNGGNLTSSPFGLH